MAEKKSFVLRMSPELWDAIQRLSADEFRSVNQQIEYVLNEYVKKRGYRIQSKDSDSENSG